MSTSSDYWHFIAFCNVTAFWVQQIFYILALYGNNVCQHAGELSGLWWFIGSLLQWFFKSAGKVVLMNRYSIFLTKNFQTLLILLHLFQSFPESLVYNQETGLFEVVSGAAEFVSRRIRSVLHHSKSQLLTGDPTVLARTPPVDNHYSVSVSSE